MNYHTTPQQSIFKQAITALQRFKRRTAWGSIQPASMIVKKGSFIHYAMEGRY